MMLSLINCEISFTAGRGGGHISPSEGGGGYHGDCQGGMSQSQPCCWCDLINLFV